MIERSGLELPTKGEKTLDESYRKLCQTLAQRGGRYPGMDIPEFYAVAQELFKPEEAAIAAAMPLKPAPASAIAKEVTREEKEVERLLEKMADKGLCSSFTRDGVRYYVTVPFVPGIFEFQFMRGTKTEKDRRMARLIHDYKQAVDRTRGPQTIRFPASRVIPVGETIRSGSRAHTYSQVTSYLDRYEPISVSTCFCRHEGKLLDEKGDCGMPDEVCMQFGTGAQFIIERGLGRKVSKEEGKEILRKAAEAGLVHASLNTQEIDFLCNCCSCHCMILKTALRQPKPGRAFYSGFQPRVDPNLCTSCEACVERCPSKACAMGDRIPQFDMDRCFGCGVCAVGCPGEAIALEEKPGLPEPPKNRKELREALEARK
jgi:Pyruvate/2-oxoacid:ferredoxin oxidoreductase delta subunit